MLAHYLKTEDLQRVLASNSPANRILLIMGEWLAVQRRNGQLSDILFISLNDRLNDISAVLAGCERIAYTPIMNRQRLDSPLVYVGAHNVYYVKLNLSDAE